MKNVLYFSDYIKPIGQRIKFAVVIIGRFFKILFKRRKNIKLLQLSYAKNYQFDNGYLIISYRFRNALWYNFKNLKKTTEKEIIVLNLKKVPEIPIELVVHGFFRKKVFPISVIPENTIESKLFKTELKGLNNIKSFPKPLILRNPKIAATIPNVNLKYTDTQINHSSYNPTDFI